MSNLYDLNEAYLNAAAQLTVDENGEVLGQDALLQIEGEREQKALSYAKVMRMIKAEIKTVDEEIDRLKSIKSSLQNKLLWMEQVLRSVVQKGEKLKDYHASIYWQRTEAVEIANIDDIPPRFIHIKEERSALKSAIKDAIKNGENVPGAILTENFNLIIK